jgi:hypothetical protein
MPEPDPHGIEPAENWPRGVLVSHFLCGNRRHRKARAQRILQNARWGEWSCRECGEPVPFSRRADARYCREACRKKAARQRKALLSTFPDTR